MAHGQYEGKTANDAGIRSMFTLEYLLQSDWYQERLKIKQQTDLQLWQQHRAYILQRINETQQSDSLYKDLINKLEITQRVLADISDLSYLENLSAL
jgi:hypothetical protein